MASFSTNAENLAHGQNKPPVIQSSVSASSSSSPSASLSSLYQQFNAVDLVETTSRLSISTNSPPRHSSSSSSENHFIPSQRSSSQPPIPPSQINPNHTPITAHSHSHSPTVSVNVNVNVLSPPTPAPSPSPRKCRSLEDEHLPRTSLTDLLTQFRSLNKSSRFAFLAGLVSELQLNEALVVSRRIEPRLKRDFLRDLPIELALHCLSFVDDAKTLARASAVSRYWYGLLQDERTWKEMCERQWLRSSTASARSSPSSRTDSSPSGSNSKKKIVRVDLPKPVNPRSRTSTGKRPMNTGALGGDLTASSTSRESKRVISFKQQFKTAYQTESNWRTGGRLLSTHLSQEDGVVTTVAMDENYLVIGMANAKIHVFDSSTGTYRRSLIGHAQGVWSLILVTTENGSEADDLLSVDPETQSRKSEEARTYVPPFGSRPNYGQGSNASSSASGGWRYRDDGQSRRASFTAPQPSFIPPVSTSRNPTVTVPSSSRQHSTAVPFPQYIDVPGPSRRYPDFSNWRPTFAPNEAWSGIFPSSDVARDSSTTPVQGNVWQAATTMASAAPSMAPAPAPVPPSFPLSTSLPTAPRLSSVPGTGSGLGLGVGAIHRSSSTGWRRRLPKVFTGKRYKPSDVCGATRGYGQGSTLVVSGGCDRELKVWNVETGHCIYTLTGHTSTIRCLKVVPGRPIAITGSRDFTLRTWDISNGTALRVLSGHDESVRCVEVAGSMAVSGSYDWTCRVWDIGSGECLHVLRGHYAQVYSVAFDGDRVVSGSLDSTVRVWSAETGDCLALLQGHTSLVGQIQLYGDRLVTAASDGRVIIFDLSTFKTVHRLCAHDNSVTSLQFDDRFVVSGGNDGRVKLWDIVTGQFVRELTRECEAVWRVVFRDDRCAILCQRQGKIVLEVLGFMPDDGDSW